MNRDLRWLLFVVIILATAVLKKSHSAEHHPFGAGIVVGAPSGLVGKYWTRSDRAIDMGLTFYFNHLVLIYSDYLFHFPKAFSASNPFVAQLTPYVGVGGVLLFWSGPYYNRYYYDSSYGFGIGVRFPIGIEWRPVDPPLGVFLEIAPGMGIIPGTFGFFQGGIGIRYYF